MPKLEVIVTSTREQRAGAAIAAWFVERAREHGKFDIEVVDLKELALPLLDEPIHPMKRQYQHAHTRAWSATVASADAFVFVVPEYNHGMPPAMLNAIDYLYFEWNYKPAGFVGYGGVAAGARSVQMTKSVLTAVKVMPIPEAVMLPFFTKQMGADGVFAPGDVPNPAVTTMLDELLRWTHALRTMRSS